MNDPAFLERERTTTGQSAPASSPGVADDEISLVDLWLVLWKHRKLVLAIIVLSLVVGLAVALLKPKEYRYAATVEIGTTVVDTGHGLDTKLIDTPETALAKLQKSFIPSVVQAYTTQHQLDPRKIQLTASIPEKSQLIEIAGKGTDQQGAAYKAMIADVVGKLVDDHQRIMQAVQARYKARLAQASIKLETLQDPTNLKLKKLDVEQAIRSEQNQIDNIKEQISFLKSKDKRLDNADRIIKVQVNQIQSRLKSNRDAQSKALKSARDEATALTTLMVSNEVLQSQRRLADLQERLEVTQPNLRQQLQDKIATLNRESEVHKQKIAALQDKLTKIANDNQRDISLQEQNVSELKSRLDSLRETRALSEPYKSFQPTGMARRVVLVLFGVLGVFLAVLAAFLIESIGSARDQVRSYGKEPWSVNKA